MIENKKEEMKELKQYQNWFSRQISSNNWDSIANRLSDLHIDIIGQVMRAETSDNIDYSIWKQLDYIKDKIRSIRKSL